MKIVKVLLLQCQFYSAVYGNIAIKVYKNRIQITYTFFLFRGSISRNN